jgi:hypothetical protein
MAALLQMRPGQATAAESIRSYRTSAESDLLYNGSMKLLQFVGLIASVAFFVGCETTQPTGMGNQEQKRLAAIQKEQAEGAQMDEADRNLWNAHQDLLYTGSNPAIPYR